MLQELLEKREAAQAAYEAFINPIIAESRNLSEDEETKRTELRSELDRLDARIDEVQADEARNAKLAETRNAVTAPVSVDARVTDEPKVYGPGSDKSFIRDTAYAQAPYMPGSVEARQRLDQFEYQIATEVAHRSKDSQRIKTYVKEAYRSGNADGSEARNAIQSLEARGNAGSQSIEERTGMSTGSSSGGSFVTPVYFVNEYAPYREAGRAFIDQCNKQDLPDYGMTVYLPHVTGPAGVAAQTENTGVQETDPTAGYLSSNLTTEAGQTIVSQQLLDRAGPGFQFDKLIFDQLNRDYAPKVDTLVLTSALANAGAVTYTNTSFALTVDSGVGGFSGAVAQAIYNVQSGAGVVMNPTHIFLQPGRWNTILATSDANGRPLVVPNGHGPFNALSAGNDNTNPEGSTGFDLYGLPVFKDLNIPAPGTGNDQAIIGALNEVYVWEGDLVPRIVPQTLANQLSVLIQIYNYIAVIPRYPTAIQAISGTGMAAYAW